MASEPDHGTEASTSLVLGLYIPSTLGNKCKNDKARIYRYIALTHPVQIIHCVSRSSFKHGLHFEHDFELPSLSDGPELA